MPGLNRALPPVAPHVLPALDPAALPRAVRRDGRVQTGMHRPVPPEAARMALRDGAVWRLAVQSPGASAVRLHFTGFDVGRGLVWVHDGSAQEERVLGPYTGRGPNGDGDFWSDIVLSDAATVEYLSADGAPVTDDVPFAIVELSHQFSTPASAAGEKSAAASCELDVNCYADWAATATGVARISFEESDGSYVCSGTLINTRNNSNIPYFLTANHCIDSDAVARTVQAVWLFQKDRCNGTLPNRSFPRSLGAALVATGDRTRGDFTLLRLNSIPDGVTFQGWDPAEQPVGTAVTVIHHPAGDYKRIAFGNVVTNSRTPQNFYSVFYSAGLTEGGSSGSGIFSAPGVLVGTLSNGPKADTAEGYCGLIPFADNYGKFSGYYPLLRDILEERAVGGTPSAPPPAAGALTSGVAAAFNLGPVTGGTLYNGARGFTIAVPEGATRLEIVVRTTTPNADVDLFVRYGQDVVVSASAAVADYSSETPGGSEQVTVTSGSTPPLRAGTYYIALALFTPNAAVSGTITATVTAGGSATPSGGPVVLSSGAAAAFSLGPVSGGTLYNGARGFTIVVPQGATRLDVAVRTTTANADLDLFVRYGQDVVVSGSTAVADYSSEGPDGNEQVTITSAGSPPLRAGTYYIALALFTPNAAVSGTVTATVTTGGAAAPSGPAVLTSGRAQNFSLGPVTGGTLFRGAGGYTVAVPQGASSLEIVLHTATPNTDLDLFARFNQDTEVSGGSVTSDYSSTGATGEERITIDANSSPPLRAGIYYISLALFTPNVTATGTLTATVNTGAPPPPAAGPALLASGMRQRFSFNAVAGPTLFTGSRSFAIDVPAGATRLDVQLTTETSGADLDLYVSYGRDNSVGSGRVAADFASEGPDGDERITITPDSSPALQAGRYYISLGVYSTGVAVNGSVLVTVNSGGSAQPAAPASPTLLSFGAPAKFSLPAVASPTLYSGNYSFQVQVPAGSTSMRVQVIGDNPAVDVDLYARYGADNTVDDGGNVVADYAAEGPTGNEALTVTTASSPPLRPGLYYISLALYTRNAAAGGIIVVTVDRAAVTGPAASGTLLASGVPATYSLPAVASPTLFTGANTFRIAVGPQHTSLTVSVRNNPPGTDVDLFMRLGQEPTVSNGRVAADFASATDGGSEDLVVQGSSLQPGVYYISLALYSTGVPATGTITATLTSVGTSAGNVESAVEKRTEIDTVRVKKREKVTREVRQ